METRIQEKKISNSLSEDGDESKIVPLTGDENSVSSQKVAGNSEGAQRPTAGDEPCGFTPRGEGGRVPPFIEKIQNSFELDNEILAIAHILFYFGFIGTIVCIESLTMNPSMFEWSLAVLVSIGCIIATFFLTQLRKAYFTIDRNKKRLEFNYEILWVSNQTTIIEFPNIHAVSVNGIQRNTNKLKGMVEYAAVILLNNGRVLPISPYIEGGFKKIDDFARQMALMFGTTYVPGKERASAKAIWNSGTQKWRFSHLTFHPLAGWLYFSERLIHLGSLVFIGWLWTQVLLPFISN